MHGSNHCLFHCKGEKYFLTLLTFQHSSKMHCFILALVSTDIPAHPTAETLNMQRKSMYLFAETPLERLHLRSYFKQTSAHITKEGPEDVCRWNGVSCVDSIVTRVHICPEASALGATVEWLPQSVEHMHFKGIVLYHGWETKSLPRNLTYMYLCNCPSMAWDGSVDLRALPKRMEELIVRFYWKCGQVHLDALPRTMRILFLHSAVNLNCHVNFAKFPKDLMKVWIVPETDETIIRMDIYGKAKRDRRIEIHSATFSNYGEDFGSVVDASKYFGMYDRFKQLW